MPSTPNYGTSSGRYHKDSSSNKKITTTTSGRRYSMSERFYENKKPRGHSSMYNSQLPPASSLSHRYYSSSGGAHHERYHHSNRQNNYDSVVGGGVSRDLRRGNEYRRYYEKSTGSGIRRVPPALTPPRPGLVPLMKLPVSSSSRYRQAPPEDHNHGYRRSSGSHSLAMEKNASLRKASQRTAETVTSKIRKRAASDVHHTGTPPPEGEPKDKRKKEEVTKGEEVVEEEIIGDEEEDIGPDEEKPKDATIINNDTKDDTENETKPESENYSQIILKLRCSYCDMQCVSFRDFSYHLRSYNHAKIMTTAVGEMKKKLSKLRLTQRDEQKKLEKSEDGKKTLSDTTSYCRVCELNFRTDPKEHEANDLHNEIKTLVHPNCEICNIEFRVWKVYLYHSVALEHVKRIALQELKEKEAKGENSVKGTNLSEEELGLELIEQRTVFACIPCVRYFPIRDDLEEKETKLRHCLTISHIKFVEEYRDRMKRLAKRQKAAEAASVKNEEETANNDDQNIEAESTKEISKDRTEEQDRQIEEDEIGKNEKEEEDEDEIQIHAEEDGTVVTKEQDE